MMIGEASWEDYHHRSHLSDYHEDYSSDLNHHSVFDILSNTINMVDPEDNSYLVSTSLKNETRSHEDSHFTKSTSLKNEATPFPNRDFQRSRRKNLHSNHRVECNEAWGACTSIRVIMLGACKLITSNVTTRFKLIKK